jgi:hypothetical protein
MKDDCADLRRAGGATGFLRKRGVVAARSKTALSNFQR